MKLIYCIHSIYNPGGMERVLLNKLKWFVKNKPSWELLIITTDQHNRPPFYPFPESVRMIDLGINYSDANGKNILLKTISFIKRRHIHKRLLTKLLFEEKADIVDSFYPGECSFVPNIKDGSKKVIELHQSKLFHLQYNRKGFLGLSDRLRSLYDVMMVKKFDKFVVLTTEDANMWGAIPNLTVIPNAAKLVNSNFSDSTEKRVIAVGRLDYQKGFDRLISAWEIVNTKTPEWHLDIFGQGEWKERLQFMIDEKNLNSSITINAPTKNIELEYSNSSIIVMSSHYEGFPMVMIEAMACGLPAVSFDFKCGPRDIIIPGKNGLIVPDNDINGLANALIKLMNSYDLRKRMSLNARGVTDRYSEEKVMTKWVNLYYQLLSND